MNAIWMILIYICALCRTSCSEPEEPSIVVRSNNPMVAIPLQSAKQEITDILQKLDGQEHRIVEVQRHARFYVYTRRIFIELRVDHIKGIGDYCALGIAPESSNHYYIVKYMTCGGKVVVPDSSLMTSSDWPVESLNR